MWEHAVLWLAAAVLCWVAVLSGGCTLIPQPAVVPAVAPVVRQVIVLPDAPWWVQNARRFVEEQR